MHEAVPGDPVCYKLGSEVAPDPKSPHRFLGREEPDPRVRVGNPAVSKDPVFVEVAAGYLELDSGFVELVLDLSQRFEWSQSCAAV